jgi:hypothetical protein
LGAVGLVLLRNRDNKLSRLKSPNDPTMHLAEDKAKMYFDILKTTDAYHKMEEASKIFRIKQDRAMHP